MDERLPDACKICLKIGWGNPYIDKDGALHPCDGYIGDGGSVCLSKDRTMIVLLDRLLNKL